MWLQLALDYRQSAGYPRLLLIARGDVQALTLAIQTHGPHLSELLHTQFGTRGCLLSTTWQNTQHLSIMSMKSFLRYLQPHGADLQGLRVALHLWCFQNSNQWTDTYFKVQKDSDVNIQNLFRLSNKSRINLPQKETTGKEETPKIQPPFNITQGDRLLLHASKNEGKPFIYKDWQTPVKIHCCKIFYSFLFPSVVFLFVCFVFFH